jgi:GNAT superfamily N-acetyltransferase
VTDPLVVQVAADDHADVYRTLVSAFTHDPVERWLYPDLGSYHEHFPRFLEAFGGRAFEAQTVWCLSDFSAVALWLPPGIEPDATAIEAVLTDSVAASKHADTFAVLEQMGHAHPTDPHWYLPWLGVDERFHGKGHGTGLLLSCLDIVDATHLPAYLETPNPQTLPFYRRHGFQVTGTAQAGTCPPITFMLRPAH